MRIDIERVKALKAEIDLINGHPLHAIELFENGEKVETDPQLIDALEHTSLNNYNIILSRFFIKP